MGHGRYGHQAMETARETPGLLVEVGLRRMPPGAEVLETVHYPAALTATSIADVDGVDFSIPHPEDAVCLSANRAIRTG